MNELGDRLGIPEATRRNPEFQSAVVRLGIWLFAVLYIGLGAITGYYQVDVPLYLALFVIYLIFNLVLLTSVIRRPIATFRSYLALALDIIAVSLAIFITRHAISPFYLFYIWIFISASTRYGRKHLVMASVVAVIAYNFVLVFLDEWRHHTFEAVFFLLLLVLLPMYQYSLLRKVQQARREAERANKAKGDFLAFMTHELRTPLTGVLGMAELLKTTRLDEEQRDYVQSIASSANVLGALIGDILDFSKIDARRLQLEQVPFDVRAIVREVCGVLEGLALAEGLELICSIAPDVPATVTGDQLRVRQILFNLAGNAVKFTEEGEVLVRVTVSPPVEGVARPHLLFEVVDSGIGIPREKLKQIFESFRQADDSTTRRYGGSGLGTTIARSLTRLMGGTIGVESEEGKGSRFWVRLPLLGEELPTAALPSGRLRGLRALIVERNETHCELIRAALSYEQVECLSLAEPEEVQALGLRAEEIDLLVIADHPVGIDLAATRDQISAALGGTVPSLFLTYAARRLSRRYPHTKCINKPFLAPDLVAAVEHLLGRAPELAEQSGVDPAGCVPDDRLLPPPSRDIRVLVAEDNEIAAKVITSFLGKLGYQHTRVQDGEAALTEALVGGYNIAIVDLRMPKLDGIEFTRRYRAQAPKRPLPIVALTANASEDVRQACLDAGMDAFLAKPVTPDALRQTIERLASMDRA